MDVSVVIPSRNAARTIGAQLDALSRQEWNGSWEVIIADNGSSDGTQDIGRSYAKRLPGFKLCDAAKRRGPGYARNAGAKVARGKAVVFCDADDVAAPGWLAAMGNALQIHDFVANRLEVARLNAPRFANVMPDVQSAGLQQIEYPPYLPHAGACGLGIKRPIHELLGGFDESLPFLEDTDYCFRAQLKGFELRFVPDAVMHYRMRDRDGALFHQARRWAKYNSLLYKRYGQEARLSRPWRRHLSTWRALIRNAPRLLNEHTRAAWIKTFATQVGVLEGTIRHRVPPVR
jgi:glycosyltransferase involved in cell wall biosynthesis